jgi:DNA-binding NarL/FixJ family response regulator
MRTIPMVSASAAVAARDGAGDGSMAIRVILADDHAVFLDGLRALLNAQGDIEVIACARDGRTALTMARKTTPDVVVMDVSMPELNGIEATRQITDDLFKVRVLCLSMYGGDQFVTAMLRAGASGYVLKTCGAEEVMGAIRTVASGQTYLTPAIAEVVVKDFVRMHPDADDSPFVQLSDREREVLQLIAEGFATKEIASRLHLSEKTVATHRAHIMAKLKINSVAQLTKYAIREGLTSV